MVSCMTEPESYDESRNFQIDASFSPAEQIMIRERLDKLSEKTGQYIGTTIGITSDRKIIVRIEGYKGGYWEPGVRKIGIGTVYATPENTADIAAHEMGHDMGFEHVQGASLMSPILFDCGNDMCWSPEDQAECERVNVCVRKN